MSLLHCQRRNPACTIRWSWILPFDSKSRNPWLFCQYISPDLLDDRLRGRIIVHLLIVVFIVDVVANADEFAVIVAAGEEDDGDAEDLGGGDTFEVGRVGFEDEFVDAHGYRPDKERVEFLIVFGSV